MEKLLSKVEEYLTLTEAEAYNLIEEKRANYTVEKSSVRYIKPTRTKDEYWVVTVKIREALPDAYIGGAE